MENLKKRIREAMEPSRPCCDEPLKCRGNGGGWNCDDDPCTSCTGWAFDVLDEIKKIVEEK